MFSQGPSAPLITPYCILFSHCRKTGGAISLVRVGFGASKHLQWAHYQQLAPLHTHLYVLAVGCNGSASLELGSGSCSKPSALLELQQGNAHWRRWLWNTWEMLALIRNQRMQITACWWVQAVEGQNNREHLLTEQGNGYSHTLPVGVWTGTVPAGGSWQHLVKWQMHVLSGPGVLL